MSTYNAQKTLAFQLISVADACLEPITWAISGMWLITKVARKWHHWHMYMQSPNNKHLLIVELLSFQSFKAINEHSVNIYSHSSCSKPVWLKKCLHFCPYNAKSFKMPYFFCVLQKKVGHTGMEWHERE